MHSDVLEINQCEFVLGLTFLFWVTKPDQHIARLKIDVRNSDIMHLTNECSKLTNEVTVESTLRNPLIKRHCLFNEFHDKQ